jgi:hypothetical protein
MRASSREVLVLLGGMRGVGGAGGWGQGLRGGDHGREARFAVSIER